VVRFPRGSGYGAEKLTEIYGSTTLGANNELPARGEVLPIGKGRVVKKGEAGKAYRATILSIGTRLVDSVMAARAIEAKHPDVAVTVADARFMKPLDEDLIRTLANESDVLVTVEEGSKGGFGDHVLHFLAKEGLLDRGTLRARTMVIPDIWIEAGPIKDQYDIAGLNEPHIVAKVEELVKSIRDYRPSRVIDMQASTTTRQSPSVSAGKL
jgi:1-deoxy-D-xylulose-5-phosphate synthase